jgi:DNA primase
MEGSGMRLTDAARTLLEETAARYEQNLSEVASYLAGRGITEEAARTFRLGYVKGDHPGDSDYGDRLAIPYVTPSGVVDIRYRALMGDGPKYLSRPGAKTKLFNVKDLNLESSILYVTEGEMDTIIASSICGLPTVGVPGANNWQPHFKLLMQDYRKVVVLCDGDEAGRQFGRAVCKEVDTAISVSMPTGMDVNDVYLSGGKDAVLRSVEL